mgnify:FL=1
MFTLTRCFISDGLFGKVHFHFHLRIGKDRVKEFLQKSFSNNYRKYEVVQLIIFVNIGKEARYYHTETISGNRQAACSRLEPEPKFLPATNICPL